MENVLYNISQVLGLTIIHSLWQGLLIYFILRMALMFSAQLSSSKKYLFAVTGLLAITGWFFYTLVNEIHIYNWLAVTPAKLSAMPLMLDLPAGIHQFGDQSIRYYYSIEEYLPYITIIYVAGLLFNTTMLVLSRKKLNTVRQTMSIDVVLQQQVKRFTGMLNISKNVKIGLSKLVDVPCMTGYFKPVILLPFTLATYLSAEEIEAILLHELAHIKRNDYLINMLQQVLSILLFFNPCVQLINKIINEERENCCDDLVVKATADPIIYAKALLKLEQTRQNDWQLALAATGKKYHLLNRIERIMKTKKQTPSLRPALLAMLILTIGIGSVAMLNPEIAQGKISVKALSPVIKNLIADTTKKKPAHLAKNTPAKKAYHSTTHVSHYNGGAEDKKLEELTAEVNRRSEALSKYYNSEDFKATQSQMEQMGKQMQELYNNPEIRRQQEEMAKAGAKYSMNWSDNDKLKDIQKSLGDKGKNIGAYYSSPEFKKLNRELKAKYGIPENEVYSDDLKDDNYKKYQAELETHIPASVKLQQDDMRKLGNQIRSEYETPEFKAQTEHLKALGDSMGRTYNNPEFKQKQKEMQLLGEKMSRYQDSPEMKKQRALLEEAVRKMTAYIKSSEYRNYIKSKMNYSFNFDYNDDSKPEKPEKPERTEKPEKPDKPEQPEGNNY